MFFYTGLLNLKCINTSLFTEANKYNAMAGDEACIYISKMNMILFNSYLNLKAFGMISILTK